MEDQEVMENEEIQEEEVIEDQEQQEEDILDDEEGQEETPLWLDSDEEEPEESQDTVPTGAIMREKDKRKKIKREYEELEKKYNELLSSSQQGGEELKVPQYSDYDTDEEYSSAMADYHKKLVRSEIRNESATQEQTNKIKRILEETSEAVANHEERASELVQKHGIKPELFKQAESNFREIVAESFENESDEQKAFLADTFIKMVGPGDEKSAGSEKVAFHIGRNKAAGDRFRAILAKDKSGVEAAFYLGQLSKEINGTKKQTSRAPAPAPSAPGDETQPAKGRAFKRAYDKAAKANNGQAMYNAKRDAKKAGIDVSNWS